jgi:hypothetical protein
MIKEINQADYANHCTVIAFDGSVFDTEHPNQPFYTALAQARMNEDKKIASTAELLYPKFQKLC